MWIAPESIMHRPGLAAVLLGMAVAAHAAQAEDSVFVPNLDLLTIQTVQFDAAGLARTTRYRFTASIVPVHSAHTAPFGLELSSTSRLTPVVERQKVIAWAANADWTRLFDSDRTSWSPLLRLESKGERLELIPRRHSVWIQWRKELP